MTSRLRFLRSNLFSTIVLIGSVGALLAAALNADGYRTPKLDLHDAGVWISWSADQAIGRTNTQVNQVDIRVGVGAASFDLLQADEIILVHQPGGKTDSLVSVDGTTATPGEPVKLPGKAVVDLAGPSGQPPTAAVLSPEGNLWIGTPSDILSTNFGAGDAEGAAGDKKDKKDKDATPPTVTVTGANALVVGFDGVSRVHVPKTGKVLGYGVDGSQVDEMSLPKKLEDHKVQLSSVGSTPVVLDQTDGAVYIEGTDPIDVAKLGANPVLQLPGPRADAVFVATDTGLVRVPLTGGPALSVADKGSPGPARPLYLSGCAYGAWGAAPSYAKICEGATEAVTAKLPGLAPKKSLRFRTNRGKVVINEIETGTAYVLGEGEPKNVDWAQALTKSLDDEDLSDEEAPSDRPDRDPEQKPPNAEPDTGDAAFGTRPDRPVVVNPLRNDSDPNDDVLVIESIEGVTGDAQVDIVDGGQLVQVTPAPGATADITFKYTISDGFGGTSSAPVKVEMHASGNRAPQLPPEPLETSVISGKTVTHNVLAAASDPDGDPLALVVPVKLDSAQGTLTADVDGTVVYTAPGEGFSGDVRIPFEITDGMGGDATTPGTLVVHVLPPDASNPPTVRGDHAITQVGREVVIDVLANDSDADGDALRVTSVEQFAGADVTFDVFNKVHVTPTQAGVITLQYSVTDGPHLGSAPVRIDVRDLPEQQPPVAVRDDVVLRPTVPAIVDVLANDSDPNGDVLVVQTVDVSPEINLSVEVVEHRFLRISSDDGGLLAGVVQFRYLVTDGTAAVAGTVVVRPGSSVSEDQPPSAVPDDVNVRVGNVGAFDVLANDSDPEGGRLAIVLPTPEELGPLGDRVFVQQGLLRFIAPAEPGTFRVPYSAVDPGGRKDATEVVVHVLPTQIANSGPRPPDLVARTVAGIPIDIPVPVATIDPDGDAVTLLGIADDAPDHGSITNVGTNGLTYLPDRYDGGFYGTDSFTYRVRDGGGAEATATIRVGVAAPATTNTPPVAIDDRRQVGVGGELSIDVVRNDSDPDGDELELVADSLGTPDRVKWSVGAKDGRVVFRATGLDRGEQASFSYEVSDGILVDRGSVTVTVSEDEQNLPPNAVDDRHPAAALGETVKVAVLENDTDPDGSADDLRVTAVSGPGGPAPSSDGRTITLTMPAQAVEAIYTVTDAAGRTARAVARVALADGARQRPTAVYDDAETDQDKSVTLNVLANDLVSQGTTKQLFEVGGNRNGACSDAGGGKITFAPSGGFSGNGGCTYVLGDGPGDDPATLRSVGMLGVTVKRSGNTPPSFRSNPLTVVADAKTVVDLRPAATDVDEGDFERLRFSDIKGEAGGVSAGFDGSVLTIRAQSNAVDGTVVNLTFKVSDGHEGGDIEGSVTVTVSEFSGGLARLAPDVVETFQDIPTGVIPVLANDQLAENGDPLKIVSVTQPVGGQVESGPTEVKFNPSPGFHGTTTFSYTVDDGTNQLDRQVTSTVSVTVVGRPDRPPTPAVARESGAVTLSWGVPADNGAPITSYSVKASGGPVSGSSERTSSTNALRFDGLTNGADYTFEIAAINRAVDAYRKQGGSLEYSSPSPVIRPNAIPDVPGAPTAAFDPAGGRINVTWKDPGGDGTAVTAYMLEVSPPPTGGAAQREVPAAGATMKVLVEGLTNGTPYTFRVQAINKLDDATPGKSEFSSLSAPEVPATKPANPLQPQIADRGDGNLTVTWQQPETNGDAIRSYDVEVTRDGTVTGVTHIADPGVHQTTITTDNGPKFTFRVRAENKAGFSDYSPASVQAVSFGVPAGVTSVTASDGDNQSQLTFPAPSENGDSIDSYQYRAAANGAAFPSDPNAGWATFGGSGAFVNAANTATWQFQVRACNARGCATEPGTASNIARPYGMPTTPAGVTGSNSDGNINWSWNASGGNGRNITGYRVTVDGNTQTVGGTTHQTGGYADDGSTHTITVVALSDGTDPARNQSNAGTGSVKRKDPPPPTATATIQDYYYGGTWARSDPNNGTWYKKDRQPPNGAYWMNNGTNQTVNCTRSAASYQVRFEAPAPDGHYETWYWWVRMTDGNWFPVAVTQQIKTDGPFPGVNQC